MILPPYEAVETQREAAPVLQYLMNRGGPIAIDTETTGLHKFKDRVLFWSMATEDRRWCISPRLLSMFDPLFYRMDIDWRLVNAKFDLHQLKNMGVTIRGDCWDATPQDHMLDDTRAHGLKEQSARVFGVSWGEFKTLFLDPKTISKEIIMDKADVSKFKKLSLGDKLLYIYGEAPHIVYEYASCDAFFTYHLIDYLTEQLAATPIVTDAVPEMKSQLDYYTLIELPLTKALWSMERTGFPLDMEKVGILDRYLRNRITALEKKTKQAAGSKEINLNADEQVRDLLYKKFEIKPIAYTSGGKTGNVQPKVDSKTLEIYSETLPMGHPAKVFIDSYSQYKAMDKLHGTYVRKLDKIVYNGRIHCSINQAGARTSRMSTSDPSLQNIPARTEDGKRIRELFAAPPGHSLLIADYPQIEFRIAAFLAGCEAMMQPMREGWDIHSANAVQMFPGVSYDAIQIARKLEKNQLTAEQKKLIGYRDGAKTGGLAVMFGKGARSLAEDLHITVEAAQEIIARFESSFPEIISMRDTMHGMAHAHGFVVTLLGRMRQMHGIESGRYSFVAKKEREAGNHGIQGTGSEMMKLAILRAHYDRNFSELGAKLVMTVHDELIAITPEDTAKDSLDMMVQAMATPFDWGPIQIPLPVPVAPDGTVAKSWAEK